MAHWRKIITKVLSGLGSFIQTRSGSTIIFHRDLLFPWLDRIENKEEARDREEDGLDSNAQSAVGSQQMFA